MPSKLLLFLDNDYTSLHPELQEEVYREFYRLFYGGIIYIVKEHAATEDVIQESFLKVIQHVPKFDSVGRLMGWIRVVVRNSSINYLRKNKKTRNEVDVESVFINDNVKFATRSENIEKEVELKLMTEDISKYLDDLKPEYRALIELRWKFDMSYNEIADQLDTTEQKVKYKLYRAREAIKKRLQKEWS